MFIRAAPNTEAIAISRTSLADRKSTFLSMSLAPNSPSETCTSRKATARSHSAGPLKWPV